MLLNLESFDVEVFAGAVAVVECEVTVVEAFYLKTKKNQKIFQNICRSIIRLGKFKWKEYGITCCNLRTFCWCLRVAFVSEILRPFAFWSTVGSIGLSTLCVAAVATTLASIK